jgi:membrane-bound lytic murein transglycosylase B
MIDVRRGRKRRPQHARPSVLAPTRAVVAVGGFGLLAVAIVAGCAAVTGGKAGAAANAAARPAAVHAAQLPAVVQSAAGGAALAQRIGAGDFGTTPGTTQDSPVTLAAKVRGGSGAPTFAPVSSLASSGIPTTALAAYKNAATREASRTPACGLAWPLLAGIGRVESNHGRFAGAVLHSDGVSTPRIVGIPLNGSGTALIRDTDGGRLDGDTRYDRAVGPMQFIPSTWAGWGVDANGDGAKDPFNVFDAAAAAADYLCAAGHNLKTAAGQVQAILSYNYSYDYVTLVMSLEKVYASQVGVTVPVLPTSPDPRHGRPHQKPPLPPVDPGPPSGVTPTPKPTPKPTHKPTPSPTGTKTGPTPSASKTSSSPTPTPTTTTTCPTPTDASSSASTGSSGTGSPSSTASPDPCATPTESSAAAASVASSSRGAAASSS